MDARLEAVAACFYEAALDASRWNAGLQALAEVAHAKSALSIRAQLNDGAGLIFDNAGQHPDAIRAYNDRYCHLDPMYAAARSAPAGAWLNDWRLVGPAMRRTEWYNDFMRRFDTHAVLCNLLISDGTQLASVSVQRAPGQGEFSCEDERRLEPLVPHLRRAAKLYFGVAQLRERADLVTAVLDNMHLAVWVVDADRTVLLCNAAAERALAGRAVLQMRFGRLEAAATGGCWEKAVRSATVCPAPQGAALVLTGAGGRPQTVLLTPCTPASSWGTTFRRPVAVVVLAATGTRRPGLAQVLGGLYGLTPAETRVARAISEGFSPVEVAGQAGTSVHTTRTQLKTAYSKLGVRRQAELARLVSDFKSIGVA